MYVYKVLSFTYVLWCVEATALLVSSLIFFCDEKLLNGLIKTKLASYSIIYFYFVFGFEFVASN